MQKRYEGGGENRGQPERNEQPKAAPTALLALMPSAAPLLRVHSILRPARGRHAGDYTVPGGEGSAS